MSHYAQIDANNIVINVITGREESNFSDEAALAEEQYFAEFYGGTFKQASYNTQGGVHLFGGVPLRKNYPGLGFTYDPVKDAFIPPCPLKGWVLNDDTCLWQPPTPMPDDGYDWDWNEDTEQWDATGRPL